ncbi:MAG TPA: bifunctional (p)ppGpp synthetase/guanosine-3',5'-bis(diphosphate) 3'-pyrophosphohydrolase, partial [Jiangellaceae bacterium]
MAEDVLPTSASAPVRVRARLARLTAQRHQIDPALEPLFRIVHATHPKADFGIIERAYQAAARAHSGQTRKSGDPYITHPLAVTTILAELGMTPPTLAAALLHDTVEDTDYQLTDVREEFGDEVAMLVDGVTKLDKVKYGQAAQSETVRKMVVAMSKDIRVLVIKLADRLHNARTWRYVSKESARRKARETLEIYAPLAHRLGMNTIKWELEDLSFATLHPKVYDEIVRLVAERAPSRDEYLASVIELVQGDIRNGKLKASVTGRPKHYYSIYQKMIVRGRDFADIYDLVGIRILVESVRDCYAVLGIVHARWNPVPGRFKDFIAMPKFNMYQSLHTTVIGPAGKPVELQIRTNAMHRRAEYGIAAHWKYKADSSSGVEVDRGLLTAGGDPDSRGPSDMAWLRQLLDWQKETEDPGEFLESLRFEITTNEVYVFTPRGDVVALPADATPVDFAYAVHTEVGHRCIGARVNGRLVPLESTLDNGDVVEIFTSKAAGAGPSRDWLTFVTSARAKNKIKQWFSKERRDEAIETGKDSIAKAMRKQDLPLQRMLSQETLT